jgi:hypothetical protein
LAAPAGEWLLPEASVLSECEDLAPAAVAAGVEEFLLGLPLGSGRAAAEVEAAVSRRLLDAELARAQIKGRLRKWWAFEEREEVATEQTGV